MATPSNKNLTPKKNPSRRNRKIVWFLLAVSMLVLSVFAYKEFSKYQNEKAAAVERARFAQADKDVQNATQAIIDVGGAPFKINKDKSCFIRSTKFEEVLPSCSIYNDMYYAFQTATEATALFQSTQAQLRNIFDKPNLEFQTLSLGPSFSGLEDIGYEKIFIEYRDSQADMVCRGTYIFYKSATPPEKDYAVSDGKYTLNLTLGCGDYASRALYRVR